MDLNHTMVSQNNRIDGQTGPIERKSPSSLQGKSDENINSHLTNNNNVQMHQNDQEEKRKKNTNRCQKDGCRKKLSLVEKSIGTCKCDYIFCQKHYLPSEHSCNFDFRQEGRARLKNELVTVQAEKVIRF